MTDEELRSKLQVIRAHLESLPLIGTAIEILQRDIRAIRTELAPIRAQVDGIPLIGRKLSVIEQEMRMLKAAFNDFAKTNVTAGEVGALHEDVNRVMSQQLELETRIVTLERLLEELKSK